MNISLLLSFKLISQNPVLIKFGFLVFGFGFGTAANMSDNFPEAKVVLGDVNCKVEII